MKYSPDAYLLHESNRFITFNIRIKVVMKDSVAPDTLRSAAEKAFCRFPYYSKQIHIDEDGGIDLIPNPRTICVTPVSSKRTYLFSEEVNYQPCSIEYEDNCIYFNMYHGMCGGCGTFLWIKTTVYEYICAPMVCARSRVPPLWRTRRFRKQNMRSPNWMVCLRTRPWANWKKTKFGSPAWNTFSALEILFSATVFIKNSRSPKRIWWNSTLIDDARYFIVVMTVGYLCTLIKNKSLIKKHLMRILGRTVVT